MRLFIMGLGEFRMPYMSVLALGGGPRGLGLGPRICCCVTGTGSSDRLTGVLGLGRLNEGTAKGDCGGCID